MPILRYPFLPDWVTRIRFRFSMPLNFFFKAFLRCGWLPFFCLATTEVRGTDFLPARIDSVARSGDVLAYVLPATVFGLTACFKDGEGAWEFGESAAISMAVTFGLKNTVRAQRPDGEPHSFPSGHSTIAFSSAEFLRKRYGWKFGAPAYVLAAFVAESRVHAHRHHYRDVAAGAAIGFVTTYLVSKPFHGWRIQPELGADFRGLRVSRDF